jgi:hypothetical protein
MRFGRAICDSTCMARQRSSHIASQPRVKNRRLTAAIGDSNVTDIVEYYSHRQTVSSNQSELRSEDTVLRVGSKEQERSDVGERAVSPVSRAGISRLEDEGHRWHVGLLDGAREEARWAEKAPAHPILTVGAVLRG